LDGGLTHCKASIYTEEYNTETHGHTSMPRAGFKPTIFMYELAALGTGCGREPGDYK